MIQKTPHRRVLLRAGSFLVARREHHMPSKPREYMEDASGRNVSNKGRGQWNKIELAEVVSLGDP